jgi:hypothetical protein
MKNLFTFLLAVAMVSAASGQHLVTGKTDVIGMNGWPTSPLLIESEPGSFYWISGSNLSTVDHPLLGEVYNDFRNIFFIKYDEDGNPTYANFIRGSYNANEAFSYQGGITVVGTAYADVEANGNIVPIGNANILEFIAKYNDRCQFEKIISIWDLPASQYPYSQAKMDKRDGSIYVAGTFYAPLQVAGSELIGKEWGDYLYVLKFSRDLELLGIYTTGFDTSTGQSGFYSNIAITPDAAGNLLVTGYYGGDRRPVMGGGDTLNLHADGYGLFALKLDKNLKKVWVQQGTMKGYGYGTQIYKGIALQNGDLVLAGITTTGYFQLGDAEIIFENGMDYTNHFILRMTPDGKFLWTRPLQAMDIYYGEKKKGAPAGGPEAKDVQSDQFSEEIYWDAVQWNEQVLYVTGRFMSDSFQVAGRILPRKFGSGVFVAALDLKTGEEHWGYALSSNFTYLNGFDVDAGGNVSLMGRTAEVQDFEVLGEVTVPGTDLVFHLGLDFNGVPLWVNNAHLQGLGYQFYGADLEVLRNGKVFSSMYKSSIDALSIGGALLTSPSTYSAWLIALDVDNALGGKVSDKSGAPVYPGVVKAFKSARSGVYPAVDSVMLNEAGDYLFEGLYPGNYTFRVLPDFNQYPDGWPTYLGDAVAWSDARFLDVKTDTKATFMDISLTEIEKLVQGDGSGKMMGNVSYADEVVTKGTMGRPVTRTSVILIKKATSKSTQEDDVVAYVETDDLGNYVFENVPDGDYILIVDIPGLPMIQTYEVTIQGNKIVSGLDFTVGNEGINTSGSVDVESLPMDHLMVFPNPGNGLIYIDFPEPGDYRVGVYGSDGKLVDSGEYLSAAGLVLLDISAQDKGIYVIRIVANDHPSAFKYLKE